MAGLFGRPANSATDEVYAGIQVGTSTYGQCVPYVAGRTRIPFNLLWYGNWKATQASSGGGNKGGGGGSGSYTYSASWMASLCIGPITAVVQIWHDKALETLTSENLTLSLGTSGPAIWSVLTGYTPPGASFTASMTGYGMTVTALASGQLIQGQTVSGSGVTATKITSVGSTGGGLGLYQTSVSQTVTSRAMTASNGGTGSQAVPYDSQAWVGSASYNLGGSASMPNLNFEVDGVVAGYSITNAMFDADPSAIIVDYLTHPVHGAGFQGTIQTLTGTTNTYQAYVMIMGLLISPTESTQRQASDYIAEVMQITNSDVVLSAGVLKVFPYYDSPTTLTATTPDGTAWSYTPNLTPEYVLTDANYAPEDNDPPVKMTRKALSETYNMVQVEFLDRLNYYNEAPAGAQDDNDIALNGPRVMSTLTFHQITNSLTAQTCAQLLMQASLYERNTYEFRLPWLFGLLEPMDYLSLNDTNLGLVNQLVRILEVTDDGGNYITIKAMEVTGVSRATPVYNWNSAQGYAANYNQPPGSVTAPIIFQMPAIPGSVSEGITLGIAVCGLTSSPSWLGCEVYCSFDGGTTYAYVGDVGPTGPGRYGTTTASIAASSAVLDTSSVVSLTLSNTTLQLDTSATNLNAANAQTLFLVDSGANVEVMAYGTGVLTGVGSYNLSYLYRGLYGTKGIAHASGVPFVRLDGATFQLPIDPGYAGAVLNFKFLSYNTAGGAIQTLSAATAYTYTVPVLNSIGGAIALIPRGYAALTTANTVYKNGTVGAWDSDGVSANAYQSVSVSAQYTGGGALGVGLATNISAINPPTGGYYYGIYFHADSGTTQAFAAGNALWTGSTPVRNDLGQVTYDGFTFRFYYNGALVASYQQQGLSLYVELTYFSGALSNVETTVGALATPTQFVATGTAVISDSHASKPTGANGWDSSVYSIIGYPTAHISGKPTNLGTAGEWMLGLTGTPTLSPSYTNMNVGWFQTGVSGGFWQIYQNGSLVGSYPTIALSDVVAVTYDGSNFRCYLNGVLEYTVATAGATVYGFAAFFFPDPAGGINSLSFGPTTNLAVADTSQLGVNAASQIISATAANTSSGSLLSAGQDVDLITASGTFSGAPVGIDFSATVVTFAEHANLNSPTEIYITRDGTQIGVAYVDIYSYAANVTPSGGPVIEWVQQVALTVNDVPAAGAHTYAAHFHGVVGSNSGGTISLHVETNNMALKVREYKK